MVSGERDVLKDKMVDAWFRCYSCFARAEPGPSDRLNLLSCQHLICEKCAKIAQRPNAGPESMTCPGCGARPVRCLPLGSSDKVPRNVRQLFEDEGKWARSLKNANNFQAMQKDAILRTWIPETNRRKDRLDAKLREKLRKNQQLRQVYLDKVREVEKEKEHILALEMERKIDSIKQPRERRRSGNSKGDYGKSIQSPSSTHSSEGRSRRLVLVGQGGKHQDACAEIFGARSGNGIMHRPRQHEGNPHQSIRPLPRL